MVGLLAPAAPAAAAPPRNGVIAYSWVDERAHRSWVELVRADGSRRRRFACTTGAFETCSDRAPAFSPGGRRLALLNSDEIVLAGPGGRVLRRIPARGIALAWSPDGKRLAYTSPNAVHVIILASQRRTTVARDIDPFSLSWSSRGRLAWQKLPPRPGIYVSGARGGDARRILPRTGQASLLHWSLDGRRLAFRCEPLFCTVRPDGSGKRRLNGRCRAEVDTGALAWSPNGREVACLGRFGDLIAVRLGTNDRRVVVRRPHSARFLPQEISWRRVSRCCGALQLSR